MRGVWWHAKLRWETWVQSSAVSSSTADIKTSQHSWIADISSLELSRASILPSCSLKCFELVLAMCNQSVLLVWQKQEATRCTPHLKTREENPEKIQEVTASVAAAKKISVDVPVVRVYSKLDGIFTLKDEIFFAEKVLQLFFRLPLARVQHPLHQ